MKLCTNYCDTIIADIQRLQPDEVRIATFGLYRKGIGSALARLLRLLNEIPKARILVGYNEQEALIGCAHIANLTRNIEWRFRFGTHVKFVVMHKQGSYYGLMGSHNLSDTGFDDLSVELAPKVASKVFSLFVEYCIGSYTLESILPYSATLASRAKAVALHLERASFTRANDTEASPEALIPVHTALAKEQ